MHPITIPVSSIRSAYGPLSKVIANRTTLPVLGYFRFDRVDNSLSITGTDLERTLSYTCLVEPNPLTSLAKTMAAIRWKREAGSILVPRSALQAVIKGAKAGNVMIAEREITYEVAGTTVRLPFEPLSIAEFPETPNPNVAKWALFDAAHRGWLQESVGFASYDEARYVLNGVYLDAERQRIVATDGRRLYCRVAPALASLRSIILPNASIDLLGHPSLLAQDWTFGVGSMCTGEQEESPSDTHAVVFGGPWRLVTKLIEGVFPNYAQVIPGETSQPPISTWATVTVSDEGHRTLTQLLKQLPPPENGKSNTARLLFHHDCLTVQCSSPASHFIVRGITSNAPVAADFNRSFLLDGLCLGPGTIHIADHTTPCVHLAGGATHVLMPMRGDREGPAIADPELEAALAPWLSKDVLHDDCSGTVTRGIRRGIHIFALVESHVKGAGTTEVRFSDLRLMETPVVAPAPTRRKKARELAAA